jgi:hypothetical protein
LKQGCGVCRTVGTGRVPSELKNRTENRKKQRERSATGRVENLHARSETQLPAPSRGACGRRSTACSNLPSRLVRVSGSQHLRLGSAQVRLTGPLTSPGTYYYRPPPSPNHAPSPAGQYGRSSPLAQSSFLDGSSSPAPHLSIRPYMPTCVRVSGQCRAAGSSASRTAGSKAARSRA